VKFQKRKGGQKWPIFKEFHLALFSALLLGHGCVQINISVKKCQSCKEAHGIQDSKNVWHSIIEVGCHTWELSKM
jgi:hypothetical protein